jgi:predicted RNA binding protein YcfA (HicA-like mRNA interferase family)
MNKRKLFKKILSGSGNIPFDDLVKVVEAFGFRLSRVNGSHHIFTHDKVPGLLNLQNRKKGEGLSNPSIDRDDGRT